MACGSSSGGSRRGLISCLYSSCCSADDAPREDSQQAVHNLIASFYEEAFDRLPCATMPGLARSLATGGFSLGLLDPVSNIVLNAVSLLPDDDDGAIVRVSPPKKMRKNKDAWHQVAWASLHGLINFMMSYFGCLTKEQAIRYLRCAGADLLLAVMLVDHDLYAADEHVDVGSARTQAALKSAALIIRHPAPDTLVQLMTSPLPVPTSAAPSLQLLVRGGRLSRLTSDDVGAIRRLLRRQSCRPCDAQVTYGQGVVVVRVRREVGDDVVETTSVDVSDDGHTTTTTTTFRRAGERITSLRHPGDMAAKMSACLTKAEADAQKYGQNTTSPCARGDACEYLHSLKMRLHDTIHGSYVKALALLLPCTGTGTTGGSLMRSILVAGHCYGSMDPVSNIIVSSIWHNRRHPLREPDRSKIEPYTDILDTLSLLRTEVRSLKGLIELVHAAADAASPDPGSSTAWALETLCRTQCDIFDMLSSSRKLAKNHFQEAAMAAGHPLSTDLGLLHQQLLLRPRVLGELRALTSHTSTIVSVDHIGSILDKAFRSSTPRLVQVDLQAPEMHAKALSAVSRKRSKYDARRSFLRSRLKQLLENYASQHFWEPKYKVNFICGVEALGGGPTAYGKRYTVNFMAASESPLQMNTLFFAEFGESEPGHWFGNRGPYTAEPKPDFCSPLPPPYTGRCYYGSHSARKLVYPNLAEYLTGDITAYGTDRVADMLETDLVYFSSEGDVEFAEKLNSYYEPDSPASMNRPVILDDEESSGRQHFSSISPFCKQPEQA